MKVLAPISSAEEVEMLVHNGAEEFYVGFIPQEWLHTFSGGVWMNRRAPQASIPSLEEYALLIEKAHRYQVPVFMTLNAPYYTETQHSFLIEIIKRAVEVGTDAFIISDLGLMLAVRQQVPEAVVHVSSLATPINSESIRLYKEIGATRIVFPRSLSLAEIEELVEEGGSDLEYEVFILNDGCIYEEGFCFTTHNQVGAFCSANNWDFRFQPTKSNKRFSAREKALLAEQLEAYRSFVWFTHSCGCSVSEQGIPLGPCGLCALPKLAEIGVDSLKIVGREASPYRKLASVQLVSSVVKSVREGWTEKQVIEKARRIRKTPEHCQAGYMCYYR